MGKKLSISILFFCSLTSLLPAKVYSGPSQETTWLMNEPASLFDLGIIKTKAILEDAEKNFLRKLERDANLSMKPPSSFISYSWEQDRITLSWDKILNKKEMEKLDIIPLSDESQPRFNRFCRYMLNSLVNNTFGQNDSWKYFGSIRLNATFGHFDYVKNNMPKDLYLNLAGKLVYEVALLTYESEDYPVRQMKCKTDFNNSLKTSEPVFIDFLKEQKLKNKS
ncbi:hypothetical protein [Pseudoalteromonas sp. ND6B]|uniref:hypothetical protein n=1 Tax=Pseudoalteromonas sp. ND6B TaxID=1535421 RepID=UPI00051A17CB|nr:hypothetical protein [Pseudoalteromonas sp. ND6B]KGK02188.1 hypothetical protein ND6B_1152 [Pseudoalteromonas sp. ND6B]